MQPVEARSEVAQTERLPRRRKESHDTDLRTSHVRAGALKTGAGERQHADSVVAFHDESGRNVGRDVAGYRKTAALIDQRKLASQPSSSNAYLRQCSR
jgi:hypothetical protein